MRVTAFILLFFSLVIKAQDKVFYRDGSVRTLRVISITADKVYVKENEGSAAFAIPKSDLLLIDQASGKRYLFSGNQQQKVSDEISAERRHILGLQPFEAFLGRATVVYEHLFLNGKLGVAVPLSITYNPIKDPRYQVVDSVWAKNLPKVGFISGLDLNFYIGKKNDPKFFIGPRFRYGTDLMMQHIRGYTLQSQIGWRFGKEKSRICQHLAIGFGFLRVLSTSLGPFPEPKQSYGWYSATYRFSFRW